MAPNSKKPNNIVEEVFLGVEQAIEEVLGWGGRHIYAGILKSLQKKDRSQKIRPSDLDVKEEWGHPDAFAYSLSNKKDIGLSHIDFNRNTVVSGATGAGKNVTLDTIVENRLRSGIPVVMIDLKGDNKALLRFKALNEFYNRKSYIFSEAYPMSDKCSPILEGDASSIVNRLFSVFDWGEPYYADTNYVAIEKAVHGLMKEGHPVTLKSLYEYIESNLKSKETLNIINKLSKINNSAFGKLLSGEDDAVTFSKIRKEKASIYIGLSTLGFPEVSQVIGKLFLYELMYHAYETFSGFIQTSTPAPSPFTVVIDELGSAVTDDFISLINKCRGAGIGVCVSFQLLSDLDAVSPTFRDRLIGNMNNFFIGHCHIEGEAEYWSKMMGTSASQKHTYQTEDDLEQSKGSVRNVEEFLVHPNILKNLKIGQFVIKSFFPDNYLDIVKVHHRIDEGFMKKIEKENTKKRNQSKRGWQ